MDAQTVKAFGLSPGTELLEAQVLGPLLARSGDGLNAVDLADDDFAVEAHREIYRTISDIVEDGGAADHVNTYCRLGKHGERLSACLMSVPTGFNVGWDVHELKVDIFRRRALGEKAAAARRIRAGENHDEVWPAASARIAEHRRRYLDEKPEAGKETNLFMQAKARQVARGVRRVHHQGPSHWFYRADEEHDEELPRRDRPGLCRAQRSRRARLPPGEPAAAPRHGDRRTRATP